MSDYLAIWQDVAANRRFELDELRDSAGGLRLELSDDADRKVVILFDSHLSYRRIDEGDAFSTIANLVASAGTGKAFYEVQKSDFLAWFHEQSRGLYLDRSLQHFAIYTSNDMIDVIAFGPPSIQSDGSDAGS